MKQLEATCKAPGTGLSSLLHIREPRALRILQLLTQRALRDSASQHPSPSVLLPLAHCREGPAPARSSKHLKASIIQKTPLRFGWHSCYADSSSCAGMSRCVTHFVSQALHLHRHYTSRVQYDTISIYILPLPLQHFGPGLRNHAWQHAIRRQHAPI